MNGTGDIMTRKDVEEELQVSPSTISVWLAAGLPHLKLGRSVRFYRSDILAWLDCHRVSRSTERDAA